MITKNHKSSDKNTAIKAFWKTYSVPGKMDQQLRVIPTLPEDLSWFLA